MVVADHLQPGVLNLEQDVDSVVAAVMPKDGMAKNPAGSFLILARARHQAARIEALAIEHGAQVVEYEGKRIITHHENDLNDDMAFGFIEADLVAFGSLTSVKASIDARASNRNVVSNNDMMKLVNEIDNANAWAVGKFDAIAEKAGLPSEIASAMPAISWFSAAGHVNGPLTTNVSADKLSLARNVSATMTRSGMQAELKFANQVMRLSDLRPGQVADCFVLLSDKERNKTRDGKPYFRVKFRDSAREVEITLAALADQISALATHRTHTTPGVYGHQRRDRHGRHLSVKSKKATPKRAALGRTDPILLPPEPRQHGVEGD